MPTIDVTWYSDDQNILVFTFTDGWDWSDFMTVADTAWEMMDTVDHAIIQIFDLREVSRLPVNIFSRGRTVFGADKHPNLNTLIIVGANNYLMAVYRAFTSMLPASLINRWNMTFVDTMEEAIISAHDRLRLTSNSS